MRVAPSDGVSALLEEHQRDGLSLHPARTQHEGPDINSLGTVILDSSAYRMVRKKCLLHMPPRLRYLIGDWTDQDA